jgi:hypothetical protein
VSITRAGPRAQQRVSRCRERQSRSNTPDQFARIGRREEQAGVNVTESKRAPNSGGRRRLVDNGYNRSCYKVPVLVQCDRNYRLNIQDPLRRVVRADAEIEIGVTPPFVKNCTLRVGTRIRWHLGGKHEQTARASLRGSESAVASVTYWPS